MEIQNRKSGINSEFIIPWNSEEGKRRLFSSKYNNSFFILAHLFERQIKPTYCGIASAVIVLNALRRDKQGLNLEDNFDLQVPNTGKRIKFNYYNQLTFLNNETNKIKSKKAIEGKLLASSGDKLQNFDPGLTLKDLEKILRLHMLDVLCNHVDITSSKNISRFRDDVIAHVTSTNSFIIANFDGSKFSRQGEGHFSPIAAYHPETDSCLILDVNGCLQPWFWVSIENFYNGMCTSDGNYNRGYLIISDRLDTTCRHASQ